MGQAVVHFEVIGKDGERLQGFYSDMFGWEINADNPMNYGLVAREGPAFAVLELTEERLVTLQG